MDAREVLRAVALFGKVLDAGALDRLAAKARPLEFGKHEVLIHQGDPGGSLYAIVEGKVAVTVQAPGGPQEVAVLGPGDVVGEMSLLTGERRSATVTARRKVRALLIDKQALQALLAEAPGLIRRFAEVVEQRHAELRQLHRDATRWNSTGLGRDEIAARMTAFYAG